MEICTGMTWGWWLLCLGGIWQIFRSVSQLKPWGMGASIGFGLMTGIDLLIFWLLPQGGISYGDPFATWALMLCLRIVIVLVGIWILRAVLRRRPGLSPRWLQGGLGLLVVLNLVVYGFLVDAFYVEPLALQTTHLELPSAKLEPGTRVRIVHLTDLHVERTTARERALVERVNALEPDLILLTGDYLNLSYLWDETATRDFRSMIGALKARYGIYAVDGTVEDPTRTRELFDGLRVAVLDDEVKAVQVGENRLYLLGISDFNHKDADPERRDRKAFQAASAEIPAGSATVMLYHTPDLIEDAAAVGVDLYLAGHMHGGQIQVPLIGALWTPSIYGRKYAMGLYKVEAMTAYVSRGVGMEGLIAPRVRLFCPPEIEVIDWVGE